MAYICTKPKGSCRTCSHYRYDHDYNGYACFAKQDNDAHRQDVSDTCIWEKDKSNVYRSRTHAETYDSRVLDWNVCPYCGKRLEVKE